MKHIVITIIAFLIVNPCVLLSQNVGQKGDSLLNYTDIQGKKQGKWSKKYAKGQVKYVAYFKNNVPIGNLTRYYETGEIQAVLKYNNKGYSRAKLYYRDGKVCAEGNYTIDNKKDSIWNYYTYDGFLTYVESFKNGLKDGVQKKYFINGKIAEELWWKNNKKHGLWKWYYGNGNVELETAFVDSIRNGAFNMFYENGAPQIIGHYVNDVKNGIFYYYDADGKVKFKIEYIMGVATNEAELRRIETEEINNYEKEKGKYQEPEKEFEKMMFDRNKNE